jgi:hypothetical protein
MTSVTSKYVRKPTDKAAQKATASSSTPITLTQATLSPEPPAEIEGGDDDYADTFNQEENAEKDKEVEDAEEDYEELPKDTAADWGDIHPDFILSKIHGIRFEKFPTLKPFYKTYRCWSKMTPDQKNKTVAYFKLLSPRLRSGILRLAKEKQIKFKENQTERQVQVHKNDLARLLHLFKDPSAKLHWSNVGRSLIRSELDARNSKSSASDAANPFRRLAELFNDYKGNKNFFLFDPRIFINIFLVFCLTHELIQLFSLSMQC